MCYILCMCVCVGASDTTTASDDPSTRALSCAPGAFLGGPRGGGGAGMPPPGYAQRSFGAVPRNFFWGRFLLFLADL
jgi:hypothetical protein